MSRSLADSFSVDDSIQNLSTGLASLVLFEIFGMLKALLACPVAVVEGMNFGYVASDLPTDVYERPNFPSANSYLCQFIPISTQC